MRSRANIAGQVRDRKMPPVCAAALVLVASKPVTPAPKVGAMTIQNIRWVDAENPGFQNRRSRRLIRSPVGKHEQVMWNSEAGRLSSLEITIHVISSAHQPFPLFTQKPTSARAAISDAVANNGLKTAAR
jgi:hypothetical protein